MPIPVDNYGFISEEDRVKQYPIQLVPKPILYSAMELLETPNSIQEIADFLGAKYVTVHHKRVRDWRSRGEVTRISAEYANFPEHIRILEDRLEVVVGHYVVICLSGDDEGRVSVMHADQLNTYFLKTESHKE